MVALPVVVTTTQPRPMLDQTLIRLVRDLERDRLGKLTRRENQVGVLITLKALGQKIQMLRLEGLWNWLTVFAKVAVVLHGRTAAVARDALCQRTHLIIFRQRLHIALIQSTCHIDGKSTKEGRSADEWNDLLGERYITAISTHGTGWSLSGGSRRTTTEWSERV